ncbi:MAG: YtxH domain-containing protein [Bacteroidales bacterium]|nr:YtxH domain-containing protein [Bacteroidales bacterium]
MKANTFFALVTGLAAGVVLGMMIAPENGEENRKKFRSKVEDFIDKHSGEFERFKEAAAAAGTAGAAATEPAGEAEAPADE